MESKSTAKQIKATKTAENTTNNRHIKVIDKATGKAKAKQQNNTREIQSHKYTVKVIKPMHHRPFMTRIRQSVHAHSPRESGTQKDSS